MEAVPLTVPTRFHALTCRFKGVLGVGVTFVIGVLVGVLDVEGVGDALVGGGGLAVNAVGVDGE